MTQEDASSGIVIHSWKVLKKDQPLHGVVEFHTNNNVSEIEVGNTGLNIKLEDLGEQYEIWGDFMPSGKMEPGYIHPLKAMSILSYGLAHLREFLLTSDKINIQKVDQFKSRTNLVFLNFLVRLFKSGEHPELITLDPEDKFVVIINLKALLQLPASDPLLNKIAEFSKRAEGIKLDAFVEDDSAI